MFVEENIVRLTVSILYALSVYASVSLNEDPIYLRSWLFLSNHIAESVGDIQYSKNPYVTYV